jgi:hypothetical protein
MKAASSAWVDWSCGLALAMFVASAALAAGEPDLADRNETLGITLRVYNYMHLAPAVLAGSEEITTAIFKQAGVEVAWVDCPLSPAQFEGYPACQEELGTRDFALRILARSAAAKLFTRDEPLGFAPRCHEDQRGCVLNIFYYRVDDLATQGRARSERILGHAIAHEVGHLLLGLNAHSPAGIMRGIWSRDDLERMAWTYLLFTPDQCKRMHTNLRSRATEKQATETSAR